MIYNILKAESRPKTRRLGTQKKCKAEKGSFHRIWMRVGRPEDWDGVVNRFPCSKTLPFGHFLTQHLRKV